jgi:alginate O-acetyltransferase complex protein AlgI
LLFNSVIYIFLFLPFVFVVYFYLNKKHLTTAAKAFLVFASLFFYAWWNVVYLPIILVSLLFNYAVGRTLSENKKIKLSKKTLLTLGITANLLLLGYFKYANFFISNLSTLLDTKLSLLHLTLPLAISFFTFQQIAYLVDSYRGETKEYDFLNYALFVTFFPQLIAGPIVHHSEMMPQFAKLKNSIFNYSNIALGLFIFTIGLFKKVVIADTFAQLATIGFDQMGSLNFYEAWATSLSYTFQLYFDFSGYTDMAIGSALLFNIKLPTNFLSPYKATSIQDFWRRWHITLSRFLKDYIYIPLGGNRKGELRTYTNLFTTFLLGGLWHGAGWTFIFWGALHGLALIIHRAWKKLNITMPTLLAWFITFNFINIGWVFFRANNFHDAIKVLKGMFDFSSLFVTDIFSKKFTLDNPVVGLAHEKLLNISLNDFSTIYIFELLTIALIVVTLVKNSTQLMESFQQKKSVPLSYLLATSLMLTLALINIIAQSATVFLYFNF